MNEIYVIHVTKQCNMKCLYCYEEDKTSTYTLEEVKEYIDNLIESRTNDVFSIEFLGGEPMLAWDIIQEAYEYIETKYHDVVNIEFYTITTNGTILTDHVLRYLKDNKKIHYAISMDGSPWANQLRIKKENNENSYFTVKENIEKLIDENLTPGIHMVTHPFNVMFMSHSIKHLYNLGIKRIGIGTIESTMEIDEEYSNIFLQQLDEVSKNIISGELKGLTIDLFESVKPKEDVRSYIYDESGKVVGESYGRSGDDISHKDDLYTIKRSEETNEITDLIFYIRQSAYLNNKKNIENFKMKKSILKED